MTYLTNCHEFQSYKTNVVFEGEPGVGKTAVAEGLATRIALGQVPQGLKGKLYSLDIGALFAGAGKGEYEEVSGYLI
jgi:ATP-dependent Clp protease ATP-binding subunit ClpB